MNAMLNIQIRVLGQQAAAQLKMMQGQLNAMERQTAAGGRALSGFGGNMGNLTNRMERFGKNIQWSGRQLEYNFTLPLLLAGAASTKWALENEKSMVRVRKVYGDLGEDVGAELEAIEKSFTLLSNRFGVHKSEVADIGAAWAQAGAAGVALSKATRSTLEAMILGELEAVDATEKMIAVQSAYRLNTDELAQAISDLNVIENQTSINFGGLIEVITRAGGASRAAGIDLRHLGAMASVLVPAAGSASQAGNAMRTMFSRLLSPTKQAAEVLNEMGLEIDGVTWLSKNGTERLEELSVAFNGLTQNQKAVVSSTVASRWQINRFNLLMEDVYLSLDDATRAQSSYATALDATEDSQRAAAITARELSTVLSSSPRAFAILTTNIKNAMAEAILPLLPVMISLLKGVADLVKSFNDLAPSTQQIILTLGVMLMIVGPLGRYVGSLGILFATLGHAFHGVMTLGRSLISVFFGMTSAQAANLTVSELENASFFRKYGLIGGLARIIAGPFVLAYRGLIGVMSLASGSALTLAGHLGHGIWTALRVFSAAVFTVGGAAVSWLVGVLPGVVTAIVAGMGRALVAIPRMAMTALTAMRAATAATIAAMKVAWLGFSTAVTSLWAALPGIAAGAARAVQVAWTTASTALYTAWHFATNSVVALWRTLPILAGIVGQATGTAWRVASVTAHMAWQVAVSLITALWYQMPLIATAAGRAVQAAWWVTATAMRTAMTVAYTGMIMATRAFVVAAAINFRALPVILATATAAMRAIWTAFTLFMVGTPQLIFRAFWLMVTAITSGFGTMIAGIFKFSRILVGLKALIGLAIANPFTVAVGVVVAAIVALTAWVVHMFRDEIVGGIMRAFNMLPDGIQRTLITVVRMIQSFALAVYEWLSYLNPFARHSPSLVDSVTRGVSTILDQYQRLYGVKAVLRESIAAHQAFLAATGAASRNLQMEEFKAKKADIVAVSPNAGPSVDRLIGSIWRMYGALGSVNTQIQSQLTLVMNMERSLTAAMKPYTDALAVNERQQKELRLELLLLQEQGGASVEDLANKYSLLGGEIEKLYGMRNDLRSAGAGSDVLGPIDQQIGLLEDQRRAMQGQVAPIDAVQKKLNELQRAGEILQLQTDLKFDPQIAALDLQKQKLQELEGAYRDIESAINDMEGALNTMASDASQELSRRESAANARKAAKEAKKATGAAGAAASGGMIPDAIERFQAGGDADFAVPEGSAPPGLGREGGLAEIEEFNKALEKELEAALGEMGGFDFFKPFKDMWNAGWKWVEENVWPYVEPVWKKVKEFWDGIEWGDLWSQAGDIFGGLGEDIENSRLGGALETVKGWFGSVKDFVTTVWEAIWPVIETVATQIWQSLQSLGGELQNWAPLWDDLVEAVRRAINGIGAVIVVGLAVIMGIWKLFWPTIREVVVAFWNFLTALIRGALEVVRGVITVILAAINGDWSLAWQGFLTIVDGIWDMIFSVFKFAWDFIVGIVRGIVEGIVGFFQWLYDVLVGHSIIPDMVDAIIAVFNFMASALGKIWNVIWTAVKWVWDNIAVPVFNAIKWFIDNVLIPAFNALRAGVKTVFDAIGTVISWAWNNVISPVWTAIKWYIDNALIPVFKLMQSIAKTVWDAIGTAIKWAWDNVIKKVFDGVKNFINDKLGPAFTWIRDHATNMFNGLSTAISNIWNGIISTIGSAVNIAIGIINKIIDGINMLSKLPGININIRHIGTVSWGKVGGGGGGGGGGAARYYAQGTNRIPENPYASPVGAGFKTNRVRAIVGEGNPLYPEYVIPTDPNFRKRALGLAQALAGDLGVNFLHPQYERGGVPMMFMGGVMDLAGDAWDATGGKVASGIRKGAAMGIFGPVNAIAKAAIDLIPVQLIKEAGHAIRNTVYNWVKGTDDKVPDAPVIDTSSDPGKWRDMFAAVKQQFPWAVLHSGFRPGSITATGNASYHGKGRAIDIPPSMDIFNWLHANYPNSRELIYSPAGGRQIRNGAPHMYSGVVRGMHWDHVHWAMAQGGLIPSLAKGGIVHPRPGGTLVRLGEAGRAEAVQPLPRDFSTGNTYNFYGDLTFPNVKNGDDADDFMRNLTDLAGV